MHFFTSRLSSLDVLVFGYLDLIAQYQLPGNNQLETRLDSLAQLTDFCNNIRQMAFPEIKSSEEGKREERRERKREDCFSCNCFFSWSQGMCPRRPSCPPPLHYTRTQHSGYLWAWPVFS